MQSCKKDPVEFENALSNVSLTPLQQNIVKGRYIPLIKHIRHRTIRTSILFKYQQGNLLGDLGRFSLCDYLQRSRRSFQI